MTDVVLIHTSGGLIGDAALADLREDKVGGDGKFLADVAGFTSLDGSAPTRTQHENDLDGAFRSMVALWAAFSDELDEGMEVGRLRDRLLRPLMDSLGFDLQYQRSHLRAGDDTFAVSHLGWAGDDAPPLLLVSGDLDERHGKARSWHNELQQYLNAAPQRWGIVTNGIVLRLVRDFHHTTTKGYVEFELASIFEAGSFADWRALYRCCHASRFRPQYQEDTPPPTEPESDDESDDDTTSLGSEDPQPLLEVLYDRSLTAGVAAGKRLQPQVRQAVEAIANGVLESSPELRHHVREDSAFGRVLYREILTVLYRTLFLLFAEQRDMLRGANDLYDETYSITRLRKLAEQGGVEARRSDLWVGLKATFAAFYDEKLASALGVYPYNGQLFDPARTPTVNSADCSNQRLTEAIRALTTIRVGKVPLHVDYRNLGVEELGTVYESLLDYTLSIAEEPTASDDRKVLPGQAYLAPLSVERADLASYYTPPPLVSLVLDRSLNALITEKLTAAGDNPKARADALLELRVIDPACGSGAFLVAALDRIALAVARERMSPSEPHENDLAIARRDVLQRCIYGADKDPFAVELCKVALWIHCVVPDQPLSFLDHHIVCGDSLVGWPMLDLPQNIPTEAFEFPKAKGPDKTLLASARDDNRKYLAGVRTIFDQQPSPEPNLQLPALLSKDERTFADVRAKSQAYREYLESDGYRTKCAAANLWTAAFFWSSASGRAPTTRDYHRALDGEAPEVMAEVDAIAAELNPLHWALAFPDVRDKGGFDLVIGNPPWEVFENEEIDFFASTAPALARQTSKHRKASIEQLATDDPGLHQRWLRYKAASDRLSHFAKTSGRFTRLSGKVNTYVLFTEHAANLARNGRTGLVVKSGIAMDFGPAPLWRALVKDGRVQQFIDMVNTTPSGSRVFPAVAAVERFGILVLGSARPTTDFHASTLNFGVDEAQAAEPVAWNLKTLQAVNPDTGTLPSARTAEDLELLRHLHETHGSLAFDTASDGTNPWGITWHTLFNSSTAQPLFDRREELEDREWELLKNRQFRSPEGQIALPVYEGQMANRWDHRARTFEGFAGASKYGRKPHLPWVSSEQHADAEFEVEPRYWMVERTALDRIEAVAGDKCLVAFRDVGAIWTNRRTMKACLFPRYPATHRLPVLSVPREHVFALLALLNSTTFDFMVRTHMSSGIIMSWLMSQCAAPHPSQVPADASEAARALSVTSTSVSDAYGFDLCPWNESERPVLDASSDALIAASYGLTAAQYEHVLDHFALLARLEAKELGEYRTKRLCLEAFEKIGGTA